MTPAQKIAQALLKYGRTMTLARDADTLAVKGVSAGFLPAELVGGIVQGDMKVTISHAELGVSMWPLPIRPRDKLTMDGRVWTVKGCETRYLGDTPLAHVLWVRG